MSEIINIEFNKMKELMNVEERFLVFARLSDRYNLLLDNGNFIFQTQIPYDKIVSGYMRTEGIVKISVETRKEALNYFEKKHFKSRPNTLRYYPSGDEREMLESIDVFRDIDVAQVITPLNEFADNTFFLDGDKIKGKDKKGKEKVYAKIIKQESKLNKNIEI